jgi:hypothetical protein
MTRRTLPILLFAATVVFCCVLSFYRATEAAAPPAKAPFANSVDQRFQMINELKGIRALLKEQNTLLKEQNALLQSGGLKVVVNTPAKD